MEDNDNDSPLRGIKVSHFPTAVAFKVAKKGAKIEIIPYNYHNVEERQHLQDERLHYDEETMLVRSLASSLTSLLTSSLASSLASLLTTSLLLLAHLLDLFSTSSRLFRRPRTCWTPPPSSATRRARGAKDSGIQN